MGILAISALKIKPRIQVTAIDNDTDALENTFENVLLNDLVNSIEISSEALFKFEKPYDIVVANIISSVLYFLADDLKRLSSRWLVLSGIIKSESDAFLKKMDLNDFELVKTINDNEWVGFLLKRR